MTKYTRIDNPGADELVSSVLIQIKKTTSVDPVSLSTKPEEKKDKKKKKDELSSEAKSDSKEPEKEVGFEIWACADLLKFSSPFFAQLLTNNGGVLQMEEDHPEAAANLILHLHSFKTYDTDNSDEIYKKIVYDAALSAKWILTVVIGQIKDYIDEFLFGVLEIDKTSFKVGKFTDVRDLVITHTVYQGPNKFMTSPSLAGNKVVIAAILSDGCNRYSQSFITYCTTKCNNDMTLSPKECTEFISWVRTKISKK